MSLNTRAVSLALLCSLAALACRDAAELQAPSDPAAAKASTELTVKAVDPDSTPRDTTLDIRVLGSGYDASAQVAFLLHGQPDARVRTNSTRFVKSTELVANVTVAADAVPDRYDAQVTLTTSGGKKGIGTELLTVLPWADLGTFGGLGSFAFGVNDEGSVAGRAEIAGTTQGHAFVWDARTATMRDLGTLEAYDINDDRTVAGIVAGIGPVRWVYDSTADNWTSTELPSPLGDFAYPLAINQAGEMAGWADHTGGSGAILWPTPDSYVLLVPQQRYSYSTAADLNANGWVVGYGRNAVGAGDAWVWVPQTPGGSSGTLVVLPRFGTAPDHHAEGINDAGDVVGWAAPAQDVNYPLLWRRNPAQSDPSAANYYLAPENLGAALGRQGRALDINNAMQVVGRASRSKNRFTYDAFVWSPAAGMRILPAPPGGNAQAVRLNESAPAIAGGGAMVGGNWHAIRWQVP